MVLHQRPARRVDLLDLQGVGDQPVGPRCHLAEEIRVPRGRHVPGGMLQDFQVSHHNPGSGAGQRLLQPVFLDRSAERRVAVHRRGGCEAHIRPLALVGGPLDYIVYGPRPYGHRYRAVLPHGVPQLLDVRVLGVKRRLRRKYVRLYHGVSGSFEPSADLFACDLESVLVGDDNRRTVTEPLPEDARDGGACCDVYVLCVCSLPQGRFDAPFTHKAYSPAPDPLPATWRSVLCISSFICGYASM